MFTIFQNGSNTATNGTVLSEQGATEADMRVMKLILGAPVASGNVTLYNITNPLNGSTANIAFKLTLPASLPSTGAALVQVWDFGPRGLPLPEGGNLIIDQTMQVTLIMEYASQIPA